MSVGDSLLRSECLTLHQLKRPYPACCYRYGIAVEAMWPILCNGRASAIIPYSAALDLVSCDHPDVCRATHTRHPTPAPEQPVAPPPLATPGGAAGDCMSCISKEPI